MLMALGLFIFEQRTTPHQSITENKKERFSTHNNLNSRPTYQHIGTGEDTLSISGVLYPEFTGGRLSLYLLEKMMRTGGEHVLVDFRGVFKGTYIIEGLTETRTHFFVDGQARKIEFTLALKRTDNNRSTADTLSNYIGDVISQVSL